MRCLPASPLLLIIFGSGLLLFLWAFFSFVQDFLEPWSSINIFWSWFYSCFILHTRFWPNVSNLNHTRLCHFKDLDDIVFTALLLFHKLFIFPFFLLFFQNNNKRKYCKIVWHRLSQKSLWILFWQISAPKRKSKVHVFSSKIV